MTTGVDSLTVRLSGSDPIALKRVQYELNRRGIEATTAADPVEPGTKSAADLVPVLVVMVAGLAEARKLVQILTEAHTRRMPSIEASVKRNGDRVVKLTNGGPDDLTRIIEGHYRDPDGGA